MLLYVRSIREGNFQRYVESISKITPWMFALDHVHYSRWWLPVHIHDMMALSEKHPEIATEFHAGKFVIHKTSNNFSAMAVDQCHEQNNATVKESGGAIGLTTDPSALRRWMVVGPEVPKNFWGYLPHSWSNISSFPFISILKQRNLAESKRFHLHQQISSPPKLMAVELTAEN